MTRLDPTSLPGLCSPRGQANGGHRGRCQVNSKGASMAIAQKASRNNPLMSKQTRVIIIPHKTMHNDAEQPHLYHIRGRTGWSGTYRPVRGTLMFLSRTIPQGLN